MITSLLIANRGEIACRIMKTAKRLGIRTVAVYSDADAQALHVRSADEAVHIGPSPARESYLVGEKIIAAARATGAEAIHPGYGFLSENAAFARAVKDTGLIWVGPDPASILAMGLKDAAKKRMQEANVPTTPGYLGEDQSLERLQQEADAIGYPVLIKAVAGGGGKGMRKVDAREDFTEALASCRREAASSFGDDRVLLEKWITSPRHIEVQIFGDTHGNVVHLFERDCSLQRRHQKVIEEAPAPGMDEATRAAICAAAVRAAKAIDYVGAGTIEFIADASEGLRADRIWFMEMNTRLQVEHPVTEEITGQDLVEWQLRVASGEPLPKAQGELAIDGWAMETRLYAEDPAKGFLPSIGRIEHMSFPDTARIDTGVREGASVSPFYDPMIAKIIVHRPTRDEAINALRETLDRGGVGPLITNSGFLYRLLGEQAFRAGEVTTGYIDAHVERLTPLPQPSTAGLMTAVSGLLGRPGTSPWESLTPFRLNADPRHDVELADQFGRRFAVTLDGTEAKASYPAQAVVPVGEGGDRFLLRFSRGEAGTAGSASDGAILSPMPGKIIAVAVRAGDKVTRGQKIVTVEAMKMEHSLVAPFDGTVSELSAVEGDQIVEGALLAKIEKEDA